MIVRKVQVLKKWILTVLKMLHTGKMIVPNVIVMMIIGEMLGEMIADMLLKITEMTRGEMKADMSLEITDMIEEMIANAKVS